MSTAAATGVPLTRGDYKDLARALQRLDLLGEAERVAAEAGEDDDARELALGALIARERLPGVFGDLLAYGAAVRRVRTAAPPAEPNVARLTPWLRAAWRDVRARFPIRAFVNGDADDALKLGERPTHYLIVADPYRPGRVMLAEIESEAFLAGLAAAEPLHELLERTRDVTLWIGWLHALALAGIVVWLRPER